MTQAQIRALLEGCEGDSIICTRIRVKTQPNAGKTECHDEHKKKMGEKKKAMPDGAFRSTNTHTGCEIKT